MGRESISYDVAIVGGGPSGLSAAIRPKKQGLLNNLDLNVCLLEKGAEIGAHILSGAIFDPCALNELIPDWKNKDSPLKSFVTREEFHFLISENNSINIPKLFTPPSHRLHASLEQKFSYWKTRCIFNQMNI